MNRFHAVLCAAALLGLSPPVNAIIPEGKPPFIVGPLRDPLTLEQALKKALKKAPPSETQLTLAVGSEGVYLPQEAPMPATEAKAPAIATAFGLLTRDFHGVTAIAPATMTVLNANPGKPDPYDGMPPQDAFRLLLGSLSADQRKTLIGKQGLGVSDLTTSAQQALYQALFPDKVVSFIPRKGGFDQITLLEAPPQLEMAELLSARLRLARRVTVNLPQQGGQPGAAPPASAPVTGAPEFLALGGSMSGGPRETIYGATLRATVPNALKKSDLDDDGDAFSADINLSGVKTVGDLVTRIGVATRMELYADRRYEKQNVLLLGPPSARARDLLRALALCVRGAYRKVGGAYVLTNDLLGSGTRRILLTRFSQQAEMDRNAAVEAAAAAAFQNFAGVDIPMLDDALTMTGGQQAKALADADYIPGDVFRYTGPLNTLSTSQRTLVQALVRDWNASHPAGSNPQFLLPRLTTEWPIELRAAPTLLLETDAVHGPVVMDSYLEVEAALSPPDKVREEFLAKHEKEQQPDAQNEEKPSVPEPNAPALKAAFAHLPRRAVIAQPRTAAEVDAIVARMKAIGFNELWLDVFSKGKSHLQDKPDILTEALAQTKGSKISVVPAITPLDWGEEAPKELQDRTAIGENSVQAGVWEQRYENVISPSGDAEAEDGGYLPSVMFVSPLHPAVVDTLTEQIRAVAGTPGVGAIAVLAQEPPGYEPSQLSHDRSLGYTVGYTEPLRLGFLRARHVDPVDIDPEIDGGPPVSLLYIPEFRDYELQDVGQREWDNFRAGAFTDFMRRLLAAARTEAGPPHGFLVPSRGGLEGYDWYGLWEDPKTPIPYTDLTDWTGDAQPQIAINARKQSRRNVKLLNGAVTDSPADLLEAMKTIAPAWDGFAIDLTDGGADDATLADLAKNLKQTPPK